MFNTDKPIERIEQDLLNRTSFSKELARAILSYTDTENFAVSLCGKWGCGKTSILNMVVQEINELSKEREEEEKPIIINFNPWNYSDKNQLITQFFKEIFLNLKKADNNEKLKQAGDSLQKYSSVFDYAKYIPVAGEYIALLKPLIEGVGKHLSEVSEDMDSIGNQKNLVIKSLQELKQKIIVIIDDIDRLNNEQIRLIFQLVNSVAGFPNMIYLFSFDRSVVVRALSEEQNCDGEEYLEKIIQVPFDVPVAKKELLDKILFRNLENIVGDQAGDKFDKEYWHDVYNNCISKFINSIRDVNRIINSFKLKYALMHDETNWVDLLCITTLQISAPEIYDWIRHNVNSVAGAVTAHDTTSRVEQEELKKQYMTVFRDIYPKNPEIMFKTMQALFPRFSWKTGGYSNTDITKEQLRYFQRLASHAHSSLYFHLSLEDVEVSRNDVMKTILEYNSQSLQAYFKILKGTGSLRTYLQELNCCIDKIPEDRIEMIFNAVIELQMEPDIKQKDDIFTPSIDGYCSRCVRSIFKKLGEAKTEDLLLKYIREGSKGVFLVLTQYILNIERDYGRIGNSVDYPHRVISEDSLDVIEKECSKKFAALMDDDTFLDNDNFYAVRILWLHVNQKQYDEYMRNCLKKPHNIPKYLYYAAGNWHSFEDRGWNFEDSANLEKYLTSEVMYNGIQELKGTEVFNNLKIDYQRIAIAYSLWYESNKEDYHEISMSHVDPLIQEWLKK